MRAAVGMIAFALLICGLEGLRSQTRADLSVQGQRICKDCKDGAIPATDKTGNLSPSGLSITPEGVEFIGPGGKPSYSGFINESRTAHWFLVTPNGLTGNRCISFPTDDPALPGQPLIWSGQFRMRDIGSTQRPCAELAWGPVPK